VQIAAGKLADLPLALADCHSASDVRTRLAEMSVATGPGRLQAAQNWIDECFGADEVEAIVERLRAMNLDAARAALSAMEKASPTSLKVTLRNVRAALSFTRMEQSFQQDYRIALASIAGHDFIEGIRATIVDKDRNPKWQPAKLSDVTADIVERHFKSVGKLELSFPD